MLLIFTWRLMKLVRFLLLEKIGKGERPWNTSDARLVLVDGSIWNAKSFGASGTQVGEVVFNTSLTGYQEILTYPSYAGQFVLMTNPHIGNTGINLASSKHVFVGPLNTEANTL
ncbi:hypothetical protein TanjilG_05808 [Lupinus angustifolius]|uniref:Carbamoyl-phosphate synthase small subunit N-terminal domain-containing protein n=1 Tax=Lupinus angustifolius TaxID=3871 RepID=A0A4P1R3E3_LUPAN|nr:hypothetical protein TanjilG_05808 [Lupinus angustifolius]